MKLRIALPLVLLSTLFSTPALADDYKEKDRFYNQFGAYLIGNTNTLMAAEYKGVGAIIDTGELLDMDTQLNVGRISGYWRFHRHHRLDYAFYNIKREGAKTIQEDLEWNGETFVAGTNVNSLLEIQTAKINYSWSFYRNEKVELGIGGGLHITQIKAALDGTIYSGDPASPVVQAGREEIDVTAPLPVAGLRASYAVNSKIRMRLAADVFALRVADIEGNLRDTRLGVDWRFSKHVGLGGSLISTDLYVEAKDGDEKLKLSNQVNGAELFVSLYF
jgi:hypothetical protein